MIDASTVCVTGGSGLLGGELKKLLPDAYYPSSGGFNLTDYAGMASVPWLDRVKILLHGAAFTSPPKIDQDPVKAIEVNIIGTANVVRLCAARQIKLVYISTDYVFRGDQGNYTEESPVFPVNKYAWSKLGGECAVRLYDRSLIVRTTFGPNVFPYEKAFGDQWTSRESVRVIAGKIVKLLDRDICGTIHVGGRRRTVFEYAKSLDETKAIQEISIKDMKFTLPPDTSLDCGKYERLVNG